MRRIKKIHRIFRTLSNANAIILALCLVGMATTIIVGQCTGNAMAALVMCHITFPIWALQIVYEAVRWGTKRYISNHKDEKL